MYPNDEKHTPLQTRVYCYTAMPFGLRKISATNQHAMSTIFSDHMRKNVDIAKQNCHRKDHLHGIRAIFDIMWSHQLKMNLSRSFL